MIKKYLGLSQKFLAVLVLLCAPILVSAVTVTNTINTNLQAVAETSGPYQTADGGTAAGIAGTVVKGFFGLLGIIFLILIIYAGYNWMTAGGDEPKVKKATDTIKRAIIGLIIIISAYAIWAFVGEVVLKVAL